MTSPQRFCLPLVLLVFLASCGGPPATTDEVTVPGYGKLREQITGRDVSALEGRLIVLDPGHGGFFRGAVGPTGLTEAEVNLGVALNLRGLLEWAGSEVVMTRTADTDFLSPSDSTLAGDLAFRVALSDSIQPDVFLSLHHNSVASLDRTINETQTYYPLGDSGASLDLARAIHRHLVLNLEIRPARIMPGNFHVLRNATVPAVLGEPAMISHPVIEGRLSLASSQRLEAEAYFLGLLDYFGQGNPTWSGASLDTLAAPKPGEAATMTWVFQPDGPPLDPTTVTVTLDGERQPIRIAHDGRTVSWTAADTANTESGILEIQARNIQGRSTPQRHTLIEPRTARTIRVTIYRTTPDNRPVGLHWETLDGRPAPEGTIRFQDWGGGIPVPGGTGGWKSMRTAPPEDSKPVFDCLNAGTPAPEIVLAQYQLPTDVNWAFLNLADNPRALGMTDERVNEFSRLRDRGDRLHESLSTPTGVAALQGTPLIPWQTDHALWLEIPGYLPLVDSSPGGSGEFLLSDLGAEAPWFTGMLFFDLFGRVIVLDPAGGDSDPDGTGPLGLRGADLNREVAHLLADFLRGSGASVHLTHDAGTVPLPEDKVALANRVGADFFLTLGRSPTGAGATARHHHGSQVGTRWAEISAEATGPLLASGDSLLVQPSYDYLLRHTACPALDIRLPGPETESDEIRLTTRAWARAEAQALFLALARVSMPEGTPLATLDPEEVLDRLPAGIARDQVTQVIVDGQFAWTPPVMDFESPADSLSSWEEPGFPVRPGPHTVEIRSTESWQLWMVPVVDGPTPLYSNARLMMSGP